MTKNKETIVRTIVQKQNPSTGSKRGKKSRRNRKRRNNSSSLPTYAGSSSAVRYSLESTLGAVDHPSAKEFLMALVAPDMMGPIRIPRSGASQRTGLAIDRSRTNIVGADAQVAGIRVQTAYDSSVLGVFTGIAGLNVAAALTVAPGSLPGEQFPAIANIGDINLVATSILLSYFGNPLTVKGEMILGTVGQFSLAAATYNGLSFYPGMIRLPIAEVINSPIRVFGRKVSPASNTFVPPNSQTEDYESPIVLITGLPTGEFLSVDIVRTWEYRSTLASASVVPYEKSTESFTKDMNLFNDVESVISEMYSPTMEAWSPYFEKTAKVTGALGLADMAMSGGVPNFIQGASGLLSAYLGRNAARNRAGF